MNLSEIYEQYNINNSIMFKRKNFETILRIKRFDEIKNYSCHPLSEYGECSKNLYIVIDFKLSPTHIESPGEGRFEIMQGTLMDMIANDYEVIA